MLSTPRLERIPLKHVRPDPTQTQTTFNPAEIRELADSIAEMGLVQPISVRTVGAGGASPSFELISGETRFRAHQLLNKEDILCLIYPESTPTLETEYIALAEHIQQEKLNVMDEARGYFALTQPPYDQDNRQIAKRMGKPEDYISRSISLLKLPAEVQESLSRDKLLMSHIRFLARITNTGRLIALARQAADEGWSSRETEKRVNEELSGKHSGGKPAPKVEGDLELPIIQIQAAAVDLEEPDTWTFRYAGNRTFVFEIVIQSQNVIQKISKWAADLAEALGYQAPESDTTPPLYDPQKHKDDLTLPSEKVPDLVAILESDKPEAEKTRLIAELQKKYGG